jgi:hypothetical protein
MLFGHAELIKVVLQDSGYTFSKRVSDGWWVMYDKGVEVGHSRSLGDLLKKQSKELGVW